MNLVDPYFCLNSKKRTEKELTNITSNTFGKMESQIHAFSLTLNIFVCLTKIF